MIDKEDEPYINNAFKSIVKYLNSNQSSGNSKLSEITSHIHISDIETSLNIKLLKENDIKLVIFICESDKSKKTLSQYKKAGIEHIWLEAEDNPKQNMNRIFAESYNHILKHMIAQNKILVHCMAGISRSPSVVIYYYLRRHYALNFKKTSESTRKLLDMQNYRLQSIINIVKEFRPCVFPNHGFIKQLLLAEYQLKKYYANIIIKEYQATHDEDEDDIFSGTNINNIIDESFPSGSPEKPGKIENIGKYDVLEDLKNIF